MEKETGLLRLHSKAIQLVKWQSGKWYPYLYDSREDTLNYQFTLPSKMQTTSPRTTCLLTGAISPNGIKHIGTQENRTFLRKKWQCHKTANLNNQFNKYLLSINLFWSRHYARWWSTKMNKIIMWKRHIHGPLQGNMVSDKAKRHA